MPRVCSTAGSHELAPGRVAKPVLQRFLETLTAEQMFYIMGLCHNPVAALAPHPWLLGRRWPHSFRFVSRDECASLRAPVDDAVEETGVVRDAPSGRREPLSSASPPYLEAYAPGFFLFVSWINSGRTNWILCA
jgi:hypothetical protein